MNAVNIIAVIVFAIDMILMWHYANKGDICRTISNGVLAIITAISLI